MLQQFDFTVVYKPGTSNGNVDCLSQQTAVGSSNKSAKTPLRVTLGVAQDHQPPDGQNKICQQHKQK